jgi:hypothetical protein
MSKSEVPVFPVTSYCTPDQSSSSHASKTRYASLVILSEELLCSRIDRKVCEHLSSGNEQNAVLKLSPMCGLVNMKNVTRHDGWEEPAGMLRPVTMMSTVRT